MQTQAAVQSSFDPSKFIDRLAEQELFGTLLQFKDDARLLTIEDRSGRGKSALMRRLEYNCKWTWEVPVALVLLDQLDDPTDFGLVSAVHAALANDLTFNVFEPLYLALARRNEAVFGNPAASRAAQVQGTVYMEGSSTTGGGNIVAGSLVQAPAAIVNPPAAFNPAEELLARKNCLEAFFTDLKEICQETPIVVLLDAWDRCRSSKLQDWIRDILLRIHCFDLKKRPAKLVLVLAGCDVPDFKGMLGDPRYHNLVRSISSLGDWDESHVAQFLELNGHAGVGSTEVKLICEKLKAGWSLQDALNLIQYMQLLSTGPKAV
jgi:hypothetical protein